jgi:hypothetical protein
MCSVKTCSLKYENMDYMVHLVINIHYMLHLVSVCNLIPRCNVIWELVLQYDYFVVFI